MTGTERTGFILQQRDERVLRELEVMRVIDREQAKLIGPFSSTTRANARMLGATKAGLLRRFFIGTNAVGRKALYTLTPKGARVVGSRYQGLQRNQDQFLVGDYFVSHQLAVNEIFCTVKYRPIPAPSVTFIRWITFQEPVERTLGLIPDGFFELRVADQPLCAFVELDLGTETRATWKAKVDAYRQYASRGLFTERFGHKQFRVIAITHSDRRRDSLRAATAALTEKIFWFTSSDSISRSGFWSAIWQRPKDVRLQPLLPLS